MVSRLPKWVLIAAFIMAFSAGIINVVGLIGFGRETVSHLTGNTSLLAQEIAKGSVSGALHYLLVILSFFAGAVVSGMIIRDSELLLGRRYSVVLVLIAILLVSAVPLLDAQAQVGMYAAAAACGLQNAMVTTYSGATIRTAHLTGMFTDLGIFIGHRLRGLAVDARRIRISLSVISGFLCGGIAGALLYSSMRNRAMYVPAGISLAAAAVYWWIRVRAAKSAA